MHFWQKNPSVLQRGLRLQSSFVEQVVGVLVRIGVFLQMSNIVNTALDMDFLGVPEMYCSS